MKITERFSTLNIFNAFLEAVRILYHDVPIRTYFQNMSCNAKLSSLMSFACLIYLSNFSRRAKYLQNASISKTVFDYFLCRLVQCDGSSVVLNNNAAPPRS